VNIGVRHETTARRIFCFALCVLILAPGLSAEAQQPKRVPRIGYLSTGSGTKHDPRIEAFRQGLLDLGHVEGKNINIEYRYAEGSSERLPGLAEELVRLNVDVIVTPGTPAIRAAKQATTTIPIIFPTTGDPVASGLVASLARPGGNITGLTILSPELSGKRLELLKEAFPGLPA
jgi:putative ABC transport system substrate-binding protein